MLSEPIFESQFNTGNAFGFAARYPSYANYRSEADGIDRRHSIGISSVGREFSAQLDFPIRPMVQHHSDEGLIRKTDITATPGYYAQVGDLRARVTDLGGPRHEIETDENRRQTIGGSPLEGLIAEFRNNSLGDDLRKLKEAHQEIIEELKNTVFKKKSKKKG